MKAKSKEQGKQSMRRLCALCSLLFALCSLPCALYAGAGGYVPTGWEGFLFETNDAARGWYEATSNYCHPIAQLLTGITERAWAAGIDPPSIVETFEVWAGTNKVVGTNDFSTVYTNWESQTMNVTVTNQIGPFDYVYTDDTGTHTNTADTPVTRYFIHEMDDYMDGVGYDNSLWYYFSPTGTIGTESLASNYLNAVPPRTDPNVSYDVLCKGSKAAFFLEQGIGRVENIVTNEGGHVTNGTAYWTRRPAVTNDWVLYQTHWTGAWHQVTGSVFDVRYYDTNEFPVVTYLTDTNIPACSVCLTGSVLLLPDQVISSAAETVSIAAGATNTACTLYWYALSNMTCTVAGATGDVVLTHWTNRFVLYGDIPYRFYAEDLDERMRAIDALRLTWVHPTPQSPSSVNWEWDYPGTNRVNYYRGTGTAYGVGGYAASVGLADSTYGPYGDENAGWKRYNFNSVSISTQHISRTVTIWNGIIVSNLHSGLGRTAVMYAWGDTNANAFEPTYTNIYDNWGDPFPEASWGLIGTIAAGTNPTLASAEIGSAAQTAPWAAEAPADSESIRGYEAKGLVGGPVIWLDWTATNGFTMVR